ncbi:aldo/keto reductase [Christensenellaceae bacterium NSJ-44]|uniref:Aldo/keto reductase n=1 Tax=Luoshenia tenuis TaxID=2763654 RepID=A0A926D0A2_9FIRM|nr:aldo/keto reductase [Luoshenia tenuis]MBC8528629.1 aldo/keto reductase [Luoshenia tenuis]
MRFKELGKSGIKVSAIAVGSWALGGGPAWGDNDEKQSIAALHSAFDHGINLVDTAPTYGLGLSETIVGKALQGRRDKVVLATKCGLGLDKPGGTQRVNRGEYESIMSQVEESLTRLNTDYIDLYQIHWPDYLTPVDETMAALVKLKEQGKIRAIGVSNFDEALLAAAMDCGQIDCQQPQYSLLHTVNEPIMEFGAQRGVGVLSYGSLGSGVLSGKYKEKPVFPQGDARNAMYAPFFQEPMWTKITQLLDVLRQIAQAHEVPVGQVAINWSLKHPYMTAALVGVRTPEQAAQNAAAGDWELTDEEFDTINAAHAKIFGGGLLGKRATWPGVRRKKFKRD